MYDYVDNSSVVNLSNGCIQKVTKEIINEEKNYLINSGIYDIYRGRRFAEYSKYMAENFHTEVNHKYDHFLSADLTLNKFQERCCIQIYDSHRKRVQRLRNRLKSNIENYNCLWLTLTFRDDVLDNTSEDTRRTYIRRFLKSLNTPFVMANIDYGDKVKNPDSLEREHYHAIIRADRVDMSLYRYGFIFVEKIKNTTKSRLKITEYIAKLTNHAFKDSTKGRARFIYLRSKQVHHNAILIPTNEEMPF